MFTISKTQLEKLNLKEGLVIPDGGALSIFEGLIRKTNNGRKVVELEYEVFDTLAEKVGLAILNEAKSKFNILAAKCFHRCGRLKVGEMAVWVGVAAGHRPEAFDACRYIIDQIKTRLPIWKKEFYADGDSGWVTGKTEVRPWPADVKITEDEFYKHQLNLPALGRRGQKKLKSAKVLVVGTGGLGSPALLYLAAAGVGTLGICEFDNLEISNMHRQILFNCNDVGQSKAQLASERLKTLNPFVQVKIHNKKLTPGNLKGIVSSYDVVLDCTDNFPAKFLLNDMAILEKIALIQSSIYQLEGQIKVLYPPMKNAGCLRCLWPRIPPGHCVGNCLTAGVLGAVTGVFGSLQALEAIKFVLGLPGLRPQEVLIFDLLSYELRKIHQKKNPACPLCGRKSTIKKIIPENYAPADNITINIKNLTPKKFLSYGLIDIRERSECKKNPVPARHCISRPLSVLRKKRYRFQTDKKYLLFCGRGLRSGRLAQELRRQKIKNVFSVMDGVRAIQSYLRTNGISSDGK